MVIVIHLVLHPLAIVQQEVCASEIDAYYVVVIVICGMMEAADSFNKFFFLVVLYLFS